MYIFYKNKEKKVAIFTIDKGRKSCYNIVIERSVFLKEGDNKK